MEHNIDFDEASHAWRQNKKYLGKGYFKYKCKFLECDNLLYCYTTQHPKFKLFASNFDLLNKNNPNQYLFCEEHLVEN